MLQHLEVAQHPGGNAHSSSTHFENESRGAIEFRDRSLEVRLDHLAPVGLLRSEFALFRIEVAREDGEVDRTLVGREVVVGCDDDPLEVLALFFGRTERSEDRILPVRDEKKHVPGSSIADEERTLHARNRLERTFDPTRRDGLAAVVLVDVLETVDDGEVLAFELPEEIARSEPLPTVLLDTRFGDEPLPIRD